jgi:hypothetical protein
VEPDATPCCPACSYQRTGIASSARCPECGADGLDGCLVVAGSRRSPHSIALALLCFNFGGIMLVATHMAAADGVSAPAIVALGFLVLTAMTLLAAVLGRLPGLVPTAPRTIIWTVHPDGIEIRDGASRRSVRRSDIARIDCTDSVLGPISQFSIVRSRMSAGGLLGTTPVLYVRGTRDERRTAWRAARRILLLERSG